MRLQAILINAFSISYETPFNGLWRASFSMPANDPKNEECLPLRYVELFDGEERIDLFRIIPQAKTRSRDGQTITYTCEHVLATLLDDVMFHYHQIGGMGIYTADVLHYILSKQTTARWQLGTVSFDRQFEYKWENDNLMAALLSVPNVFVEAYQWTWDTSSYPWTIHLQEAETDGFNAAYIRYGVNLIGITKEEDPTELCTRLYGLGYGEGVNQLTIAEVNGGVPYLDADTQAQYGVVSRIFADTRFEYPENLKARMEAILEASKTPRITYKVDAADISSLTKEPIHKFFSGALVRVIDEELGENVLVRVVNVRKTDVTGQPWAVQLELANRTKTIASTIADLANRQRINEVYSQGATNLDSRDFADNCDPEHPAVIRFYIPEETVRINKVLLSYKSEAFRAYSKAIAAAPAVSSGPSTSSTTAGGGAVIDTQTGNEIWRISEPTGMPEVTSRTGYHSHTVASEAGVVFTSTDGGHSHGLVPHYHVFNIPSHTHGMEHTHIIPSHTHDIQYGIFEGPTPTSVTVQVDGNDVPVVSTDANNIDLVSYLSKDSSGKIDRGWHEINIAPNNLGRIVASLNTQIFVQSRGGGDY